MDLTIVSVLLIHEVSILLLPEDWCELKPLDLQVYARFGSEPADHRARRSKPRLSPEALSKRGVEPREFEPM